MDGGQLWPASAARPAEPSFPHGLRVLVVDDDPTWLKILEKMLRKCSYEVTTCGLARVALDILRERKHKFDIVISDVNMPDMDGFKLLEHIGLEMDLPVIMMSIDGETSRVMKGVQHGACDYLLKPVRMKELKNIWQHVYRKKLHEVRDIEGHEIIDDLQLIRNGCEGSEDRGIIFRGEIDSPRKRRDPDRDHSDQELGDFATVKKARVVWSFELHQKFVNAVNQIGFEKVGPKKILDLMNVPGLTRENVASHLQKYRLYLSRLQRQNAEKVLGVSRHAEVSSNGSSESSHLYTRNNMQQSNAGGSYVHPLPSFQAEGSVLDTHCEDLTTVVSSEVHNRRKAPAKNCTDSQKSTATSLLGTVLSFKGSALSKDRWASEPRKTEQQFWNIGVPITQFMQYPKKNHEHGDPLGNYSCLPKNQEDAAAVISINGADDSSRLEIKPTLLDCIKALSPLTCTVDSVSVHLTSGAESGFRLEASPNAKNCYFDQAGGVELLPLSQDTPILNSINVVSLPDDMHLYPVHTLAGFDSFDNFELSNIDIYQYDGSSLLTQAQDCFYDDIEYDYGSESLDCQLKDGFLFS